MKRIRKAQEGLFNQSVSAEGGGAPQEQTPQGGGQGGPAQKGQQGQPTINVQASVNINGQEQPLDPMTLQSKDDVPKFAQYLMQVFDQLSKQSGTPEGQ
jgi:hypothetical protein